MDRDVEISIQKDYGSRPKSGTNGMTDVLRSLHLEMGGVQEPAFNLLRFEDGPHTYILFGHQEETAYETQGRRVEGNLFYGSLAEEGFHLRLHEVVSTLLGRSGEVCLGIRQRRRRCKGGEVTLQRLKVLPSCFQNFLPEGKEAT